MSGDDLAREIDRELKALPAPRAPDTLLPRVMRAAAGRTPAAWYARPWLAWPRGWQIASAASLAAVGAGLAALFSWLLAVPAGAGAAAAHATGRVGQVATMLENAAALMRVVWVTLFEPAAFWLVFVAVSLSLTCAAIWSALERVAMG